jgi:hypothetical protein
METPVRQDVRLTILDQPQRDLITEMADVYVRQTGVAKIGPVLGILVALKESQLPTTDDAEQLPSGE